MRTKQSIKNVIIAVSLGIFVTIINFIAQRFFINYLGTEYLGLNSLFLSIMGMLSLAELGLGTAIVYNLYEPMHKKDTTRVTAYLNFYKNGYRLIAVSIIILSLLILPFLSSLVGDNALRTNIYVIFILFVANTVATYLLSYKRSILYADQKNYLINIVHLGTVIVINIIQIFILVYTKNYYLYLVIKILGTIIENLIINRIVDLRYSIDREPKKLTKAEKKAIYKNVYGLLYHNLGSFVRRGVPTITITGFLGLYAAGIYANYFLVKSTIDMLFLNITTGLKASVGNLLVDKNKKESFIVFKRLQFIGSLLVTIWVSLFLVTSQDFITLWIGPHFAYSIGVTILFAIYLYLDLSKWTAYNNFKEAAGVFYEDRRVALAQLVLNIGVSLALVQFMGVAGVIIGSIVGAAIPFFFSYPKYLYKKVLGRTYKTYYISIFSSFVVTLVSVMLAYAVSSTVSIDNLWLQLMAKAVISIIIPLAVIWLVYHRTQEYKYLVKLVKNILRIHAKDKHSNSLEADKNKNFKP